MTQDLHDALLKGDLIVGQNVEHTREIGYVLRLSRIRKTSLSLRELSLRERRLRSRGGTSRIVVLNRIRSSSMADVHRKLGEIAQWKRHQKELDMTLTDVDSDGHSMEDHDNSRQGC